MNEIIPTKIKVFFTCEDRFHPKFTLKVVNATPEIERRRARLISDDE